MISIIGAPRTGKTILAATIYYSNTLIGYPCLYVSLLELRDRFYDNFARLDLNFKDLEK